jgi:RNA polymerase primary sigma factor
MEQEKFIETDSFENREAEFVRMYEEDLRGVPVLNDEQVLSVMQDIIKPVTTDEEAKKLQEKLINTYLKKVVSWLKAYEDTAVLMPDLIQDGNMALMETVKDFDYEGALNSDNPVRKLRDTVRKNVLKAAQASVYIQENENNVGYKIEGRVNAVNECAKQLSEEFSGKVTIAQVAEAMEMTEDDIRDIVKLTANKIEYINMSDE